jgi:hypothetical protein
MCWIEGSPPRVKRCGLRLPSATVRARCPRASRCCVSAALRVRARTAGVASGVWAGLDGCAPPRHATALLCCVAAHCGRRVALARRRALLTHACVACVCTCVRAQELWRCVSCPTALCPKHYHTAFEESAVPSTAVRRQSRARVANQGNSFSCHNCTHPSEQVRRACGSDGGGGGADIRAGVCAAVPCGACLDASTRGRAVAAPAALGICRAGVPCRRASCVVHAPPRQCVHWPRARDVMVTRGQPAAATQHR